MMATRRPSIASLALSLIAPARQTGNDSSDGSDDAQVARSLLRTRQCCIGEPRRHRAEFLADDCGHGLIHLKPSGARAAYISAITGRHAHRPIDLQNRRGERVHEGSQFFDHHARRRGACGVRADVDGNRQGSQRP